MQWTVEEMGQCKAGWKILRRRQQDRRSDDRLCPALIARGLVGAPRPLVVAWLLRATLEVVVLARRPEYLWWGSAFSQISMTDSSPLRLS